MRVLAESRKPRPMMRRSLPRPAYLDYPYTTPEPAFTWWDDHKHYVWTVIIAGGVVFGAYAIWEDAKRFSLLDTLC